MLHLTQHLSWLKRKEGMKSLLIVLGFSIENTTYKTYSSIVLNLFDQLHPEFQSEHSVEEVKGWFELNGLESIVVTESSGWSAYEELSALSVKSL